MNTISAYIGLDGEEYFVTLYRHVDGAAYKEWTMDNLSEDHAYRLYHLLEEIGGAA